MLYVTDTHSLVWFLTNDLKLGRNALTIFQNADRGEDTIIIPTIVLAEISYIAEKKKVDIKFGEILNKFEDSSNYMPYNLDLNVILKTLELHNINEMHDKIITATAMLVNAKILTMDPDIVDSGYVGTIWV